MQREQPSNWWVRPSDYWIFLAGEKRGFPQPGSPNFKENISKDCDLAMSTCARSGWNLRIARFKPQTNQPQWFVRNGWDWKPSHNLYTDSRLNRDFQWLALESSLFLTTFRELRSLSHYSPRMVSPVPEWCRMLSFFGIAWWGATPPQNPVSWDWIIKIRLTVTPRIRTIMMIFATTTHSY